MGKKHEHHKTPANWSETQRALLTRLWQTVEYRKAQGLKLLPPYPTTEIRSAYEDGDTVEGLAKKYECSRKLMTQILKASGVVMRNGWKGTEAGYNQLHRRLDHKLGRPKHCSVCGTEDPSLIYEWANLSGNYEDPTDYKRMCRPCHGKYDAGRDHLGRKAWLAKRAAEKTACLAFGKNS